MMTRSTPRTSTTYQSALRSQSTAAIRRWLLMLVVLAALAAGCSSSPETEATAGLPAIELERLGGGTYDVDQAGTPRALNLWATWCAPCRAELPAFDAVAERVEGVEIVGVNVGDSSTQAVELVEELNLSFLQVLDPNATLQQTLRITGLPATIFVDANGSVVEVHSGELTEAELEERLTELFNASFT